MINFIRRLEKHQSTIFLILASFCFFVLRLPSLFEPYWYGDEGIYQVIGMALRQGRFLYSGIWDNKPPLLYLFYAIFNGDQQSIRLLSIIFGICSLLIFFALAKKLFKSEKISRIITIIFIFLFATPILEGNIANAENFMVLPIVLAGYIIVSLVGKKDFGKDRHSFLNSYTMLLFFVGILVGIAFLIKVVAVFDFAAFFLFFFFATYKTIKKIFTDIWSFLFLLLGFILPFSVTTSIFLFFGTFKIFFQSIFTSNVGYVGYSNTFIIPQGLLIFKLLILVSIVIFLFIKRQIISEKNIFIFLWLIFSLFNALFSQRPYTHYLLVLICSFCLFIGLLLRERMFSKLLSIIFLVLFIFITILFSLFIRIVKWEIPYYANFVAFLSGVENVSSYYAFFDQSVKRDYELADFIKTHKHVDDVIFLWGDNGQIYKLMNVLPPGRFIVAYHIKQSQASYKETVTLLQQLQPRYIIVLPNQPYIPFALRDYNKRLIIDNAVIYEKPI
jgi:4-amino-4-deoxy-L-arabinose transferase-like glycosyltransferase